MSKELKCWSCKAVFTLSEHADCDGCCWKCGVEIDLDEMDIPAAPQPPALSCVHLPSIQDDGIEGVGYNKGLRDAAAAIEAAGYPISNDPRSKVVGV